MKGEEARAALIRISTDHGATEFTGRRETSSVAEVLYVDDDVVVLDRTPFHAGSGGQLGDAGTIRTETGEIAVGDTRRGPAGLHVHEVAGVDGAVAVGQRAAAAIDAERRDATRRSHSATHLLHAALREVLGVGPERHGSHAGPDRLSFDFGSVEPLTQDQLGAVEEAVNAEILADPGCRHFETTIDEANHLGAVPLPGEDDGDFVWVVEAGAAFVERCGATHVKSLGDIGSFRIVSEAPVDTQVRRVEAVTGPAAAAGAV